MYKYQISKKKQIFNIFVYLKVTKTRAINTFLKSVIQEHPSRHKEPGIDTYCLGTDTCCPGINIRWLGIDIYRPLVQKLTEC